MGQEPFYYYYMMNKTLHLSIGNTNKFFQLIFIHKIGLGLWLGLGLGSIWDNAIHILKIQENTVVVIHIYVDRAMFLLFGFMTKTLNLSDVKYR